MRLTRASVPFAIFAVIFASAVVVRIASGYGWDQRAIPEAAFFGLVCWLTKRFTEPAAERVAPGRWPAVQLVVLAAIFLTTAVDGLAFNHALPATSGLSLWNWLRAPILGALEGRVPFDIANGIANTIEYVVPFLIVALLSRVPMRGIGLGPFRRGSWPSAAIWLAVPLVAFAVAIAGGRLSVPATLRVWLSNLLQNGFGEEFLFRGAILGRLRTFASPGWALLVQALAFGAWHFGLDMSAAKGDVVEGVTAMIVDQALFGYAMGYLALRTGNVAIPSAFHLLWDSLQDLRIL